VRRDADSVPPMLAFTTESAKQFGLYAIVAVLVLGVLSAIVVRKVVGKIISLVITVALAATLWGQRTAINDCVGKLRAAATEAVTTTRLTDQTCSFFGTDIKVPIEKLQPDA
jgi:hypothetical protein